MKRTYAHIAIQRQLGVLVAMIYTGAGDSHFRKPKYVGIVIRSPYQPYTPGRGALRACAVRTQTLPSGRSQMLFGLHLCADP